MNQRCGRRVIECSAECSNVRDVDDCPERMGAVQKCAERAYRRMGNVVYKTGSTSTGTHKSASDCGTSPDLEVAESQYEWADPCECDIPDLPSHRSKVGTKEKRVGNSGVPCCETSNMDIVTSSTRDPARIACNNQGITGRLTPSVVMEKLSRVGVSCFEGSEVSAANSTGSDDSDFIEIRGNKFEETVSSSSFSALDKVEIAACCNERLKSASCSKKESDATDTITLSSDAVKVKTLQERYRHRQECVKSLEQKRVKTVRQSNRCMARELRRKNTKFFCLW